MGRSPLAWRGRMSWLVQADEIARTDHKEKIERIAADIVLARRPQVDHFDARSESQVIGQMVVVSRHVSDVVAQGGLHVVVGAAVLDRCVADPLLPTYVVIGVEAVGSIAHCRIELHDMARHRLGIIASVAAVAACLEACAIAQRGECAVYPL